MILADYGLVITAHPVLVLGAIAAAIYAAARAAGLADLVERSIRRGEGDPAGFRGRVGVNAATSQTSRDFCFLHSIYKWNPSMRP